MISGSMSMFTQVSRSLLSASVSSPLRLVDLDADPRDRARPLPSAAAALMSDTGLRSALDVWERLRLGERSGAPGGGARGGARDEAPGLKPPGLAVRVAFCRWGATQL